MMTGTRSTTRLRICENSDLLPLSRGRTTLVAGGLLLAACFAFASLASGADETGALATLRAAHPRLLFMIEDQQRIEKLAKTDALLARLIERNHANATAMLDQEPVRYEIPDGKRLLAQSRKCIDRVSAMALAYRLTGEETFAQGAIKEMLIAAKFKDWNPSHFLDTAEMTTALAIGYDWLYDAMKPSERQAIRQAIVEKGLNEGMRSYQRGNWWVSTDNNWNQVCNGGMIVGALAVAEDERELAREIISRALKSIPRGVSVYKPSGAYPEGPGYWVYGTAYTCLTISALNTALGHDFNIHDTPGLDLAGSFHIQTIGPKGLRFNYADSGVASGPTSAMFLLSRTFDNSSYAWWHRQQLAEFLRTGRRIKSRFFPLEIAWYDERGQQPTAKELPRDALFKSRQDIVLMRSERGSPSAVYVGFKAGDNRTNHGHLDIGSFVLDVKGVRWVVDLGADNYNMPGYFSRDRRWQYYRMTNRSHNTLVINDHLQNLTAKCNVVAFHSTPKRTSAVVDMTDAYKDQATSALRGIEMLDRQAVHVRDELTGVEGDVRWGMVTGAKIKLAGNRATLTQDGKRLHAEILKPVGAQFEIVSTKPPTAMEKQNEGTRMLTTTVHANENKPVVISILLQPAVKDKLAAAIQDQLLSEWPK